MRSCLPIISFVECVETFFISPLPHISSAAAALLVPPLPFLPYAACRGLLVGRNTNSI